MAIARLTNMIKNDGWIFKPGEKSFSPEGRKGIVAVDFDGTLFAEGAYPGVGAPHTFLIEVLKKLQKMGCFVILWTCRCGEPLVNAVKACEEQGLVLDGVNSNHISSILQWGAEPQSVKIFADVYIDDRGLYPTEVTTVWSQVCKK